MQQYHVRAPINVNGVSYGLGDVLPMNAFDALDPAEKREFERRCVVADTLAPAAASAPSAAPAVAPSAPAAKE